MPADKRYGYVSRYGLLAFARRRAQGWGTLLCAITHEVIMLSTLALAFPEISPTLVEFGPFAIRWYSLAYIVGILSAWWYVGKLLPRTESLVGTPAMSKTNLDDVVVWAILGVILGGRLGYVLFYQPEYYFYNPTHIIRVWEGGMSFHGGFLGVLVATWLFCKKHGLTFFRVMDVFACATPIGLGLGRVANFINGELYGRPSDVAWAVEFPAGGYIARHPSQLYEAALEGLVLFAVMAYLAWRTRSLAMPRVMSGVFLIGYGLSRILVEFFREPDEQLGYLFGDWLTMGMLLSLPMVALGIWLIQLARKADSLPAGKAA
jgi:phosphatidylglycerol---prolipoprotein diacylglyceryl transferase